MKFDCLQDFRDMYKGRPIFVAGAGPSLRFVDSSLAENHIVIAVNAAIMKFPQAKYFFTCDATMPLTNVWATLEDLNCKIIEANNEEIFGVTKVLENRMLHFQRKREREDNKMNPDDEHLIFGTSSAHPATHFACVLGGSPIVLLGCDCCLSSEEKMHFSNYDDEPNYYILEEHVSHTLLGTKSSPELKQIYKGELTSMFQTWRKIREMNPNIDIINASGGCLDIFPREDLDVLLRKFSK
ncbi:MAG: DUF115 domain-containing protein [Nitrosopumilus sp.]